MKTIIMVIMIVAMSGCSVMTLIDNPAPVNYEIAKPPAPRSSVVSQLGSPMLSENKNGIATDHFTFIDGHPTGTKARGIVYVGSCVVTLCLSELLWWPVEKYALDGGGRTAIVTYNEDGISTSMKVFNKEGVLLHAFD